MENEKLKEKDWSCGLEAEEYEDDKELLIKDAMNAIEDTGLNHFVNLVTPAVHGNPEKYLVPIIKDKYGDHVSTEFVDQCGCGGYVLKVTRKEETK